MHKAGNKKPPRHNVEHGLWVDGGWKPLDRNPDMYSDEGGASRFFKHTQAGDMTIPTDLIDYLADMISPPDGPRAVYVESLNEWHGDMWDTDSVSGLIVRGTPTKMQAEDFMRVLKPGAHLLVIAPDEEPTGHTGACMIEDEGFEIRDTILLAREAGALHYVPKAARSEREEGCAGLTGKRGHEAVERKEGTAGLDSPRAGAGRTAGRVKNYHPTCKPVGIMEKLLQDVPLDVTVSDNFLGSGTTALACLKTGHSFVGIEREEEYLEIADARVRHWNAKFAGHGERAVVDSDVEGANDEIEIDEKPESDTYLMDLFWGSDD